MSKEIGLPEMPEGKEVEYGSPGYMEAEFPGTVFTADQMRAYALEAIAADRASSQVANKAEVEPVAWLIEPTSVAHKGMRREVQFDRPMVLKSDFNVTPLYATPPATTGASTVLTDERIDATMIKYSTMIAPGVYSLCNFGCDDDMRSFAREVAAQAGQVAVPEGWKLVPVKLNEKMRWDMSGECMTHMGKLDAMYEAAIAAAPSPAKESK